MKSTLNTFVRKNQLMRSFVARGIYNGTIDPKKLTIEKSTQLKPKLTLSDIKWGHVFTDHMLVLDWDIENGYSAPKIIPYGDLSLSPAISALHYAIQCFEGMKAYKTAEGKILLFRPDLNMTRMDKSMKRLALPELDKQGFLDCIKELIRLDHEWVPSEFGYSLYIRPTAIATAPKLGVHASDQAKIYCIIGPVGPYFASGAKPVKLLADPNHVRAWPGGIGGFKVGGNYAPTIKIANDAKKYGSGYDQMLWLYGNSHEVAEVGAMNIFFVLKQKPDGPGNVSPIELVTPTLERGDILPGVTRQSIVDLCRGDFGKELESIWGRKLIVSERIVSMKEIAAAAQENRLVEAFGSGTAAVVSKVGTIGYEGKDISVPFDGEAGQLAAAPGKKVTESLEGMLLKRINDIQYGRIPHPWALEI